MSGDDPSVIRSIAISREDVLDAYRYGQENPGEAVLRLTPPFHGRMRARLHVCRTDDRPSTGAIHVSPEQFFTEDVLKGYPTLAAVRRGDVSTNGASTDECPDGDRSGDGGSGEPAERPTDVRRAHARAVERWRESAATELRTTVVLDTEHGDRTVSVSPLG